MPALSLRRPSHGFNKSLCLVHRLESLQRTDFQSEFDLGQFRSRLIMARIIRIHHGGLSPFRGTDQAGQVSRP